MSTPNVFVIGGLAFLVILVEKENPSPKWCIKCMLHLKKWVSMNILVVKDRQLNH